ncbi:MAG: hypothetical protein EAY81_10715, partial [Bacteroidetes bacterium]
MKTKAPYLKLKVAIGIVGTLAIIGGVGFGLYYAVVKEELKTVVAKEQLLLSVQKTNQECPVMIDDETRLEGVMYHSEQHELEHRYTMVNMLADGYDAASVQEGVEEAIISNIKSDQSLAFAKANKVTFTY